MPNLTESDIERLRNLTPWPVRMKVMVSTDSVVITQFNGWRKTTVNAKGIEIRKGRKIDQFMPAAEIAQCFVKSFSYLTVELKSGLRQSLFMDLSVAQAFYFEQAFETLLEIQDERVYGEYLKAWRAATEKFGWTYAADHPSFGPHLMGVYRKRHMIGGLPANKRKRAWTFRLAVKRHNKYLSSSESPEKMISVQDLHGILSVHRFPRRELGSLHFSKDEQALIYTQKKEGIPSPWMIKRLLDYMNGLLDISPQLIALGHDGIVELSKMYRLVNPDTNNFFAEVFGSHQAPPNKNAYSGSYVPISGYISQLITDIAAENRARFQAKASILFCTACFARGTTYNFALTDNTKIVYYGCRLCQQSHQMQDGERVVAVLDQRMSEAYRKVENDIHINWLQFKQPADINRIEIIEANDQDIERFVMMLGNDTDPLRRSRYQTMPCFIAANCAISPNSRRLLEKMFGQVTTREAH